MKDGFSVEVLLPSGKVRRIKELKNSEYIVIIKYCENKDYYGLSEYFKSLYIDDDLDIVDCLYLLVYIRMLFVDENLTFTTKEQRNVDVSLSVVLGKLESVSYASFDKSIHFEGITMHLGLPTAVYFRDTNDLYNNVVKEIEFDKEKVNFMKLSRSERIQILDKLPSALFYDLQKYLHDISSSALDLTLLNENKNLNIQEIKLNLISNGVMEFVTAIFSIEMKSYYELMYAFYNTILKGSNVFENISPIETKILLNIHNSHVRKQNEEIKNASKTK